MYLKNDILKNIQEADLEGREQVLMEWEVYAETLKPILKKTIGDLVSLLRTTTIPYWFVLKAGNIPSVRVITKYSNDDYNTKDYTLYRFIHKIILKDSTVKKFGHLLSDKALSYLATYLPRLYMSDKKFTFELLDDVQQVYDTAGISSCLVNDISTKLYTDNLNVQVLVLYHDEKPVARALVWTDIVDQKIMDRVYPSDGGAHTLAARRYAEEQGWIYKINDNSSAELSDGLAHIIKVSISRTHKIPHIDTFKYGYRMKRSSVCYLSNYKHVLLQKLGQYSPAGEAWEGTIIETAHGSSNCFYDKKSVDVISGRPVSIYTTYDFERVLTATEHVGIYDTIGFIRPYEVDLYGRRYISKTNQNQKDYPKRGSK